MRFSVLLGQLVLVLACNASDEHFEDVCAADVGTSLLQTKFAVQVAQDHVGLSFAKLFPSFRLEDLDVGFLASAKAAAYEEPVFQAYEKASPQEVPELRKRLHIFNPSVFQTANGSTQFMARLESGTGYCCSNTTLFCHGGLTTSYQAVVKCQNESGIIQCSRPLPDLQDPHAFTFNGRNYALANQYEWEPPDECTSTMQLVDAETGTVSPIYLPNAAKCEKNWAPFVSNGELLMSYQISPKHMVLRCDIEKKLPECELVYSSRATLTTRGLPAPPLANLSAVRGNTPYIELDDERMLSLAHRYDQRKDTVVRINETFGYNKYANVKYRQYWHSFYTIERRAPYRVVANTPWFEFPQLGSDGSAEWSGIQYASGLVHGKEGEIVVSFGVGDCHSRRLTLHVSDVKRALSTY